MKLKFSILFFVLFLCSYCSFGNLQPSAYIEIIYTDHSSFKIPLQGFNSNFSKSDTFTQFILSGNRSKTGIELNMKLKCLKSKSLKFVDLVLPFSESLKGESLVYFNNSFCTNSWSAVQKPDDTGEVSRELVLFKNQQNRNRLNLAFSSFNRFFTYFKTYKNKVIVRQCMEDRPLRLDEDYILEKVLYDVNLDGAVFFDQYALMVKGRYGITDKSSPVGWSSWSRYYNDINAAQLLKDAAFIKDNFREAGMKTFQIDDGWFGKSWGDWLPKELEFPGGMKRFKDSLQTKGLDLGLWYAPTLFRPASDLFKSNYDFNVFYDGKIKKAFGGSDDQLVVVDTSAFYPLDLANPKVQDLMAGFFKTATKDYQSNYFKLDFLIRSLLRSGNNNEDLVTYPNGDYMVAEYRKTLLNIRNAIGKENFIVGCGAPIGESIGLVDGMRISPDITWRSKTAPPYWSIFTKNIINIILRTYFHNRFFVNDPDALVLRDFSTGLDQVNLSDDQAKTWAVTVGMSGGSVIVNEEMNKLAPGRLAMIRQLLPVYGVGCKPLDFFKMPYPDVTFIDIESRYTAAKLVAIYNLEGTVAAKSIDVKELGFKGEVLAIDAWSKEIKGAYSEEIPFKQMPGNSVEVMLIKSRPDFPAFLFLDANMYMGAGIVKERYDNALKLLDLNIDTKGLLNKPALYIYIPKRFKVPAGLELAWKDEKGSVFKDIQFKGQQNRVYQF